MYPALVWGAPDPASILPFCAASVSLISLGKANLPIWTSFRVLVGCMSTATLTILPFRLISWIWTGPYEVLATFPLTAVSPAGKFLAIDPCGNAPGTTSVCPPPEDDGEVEDEEVEVPPVPVVAATGADGTCDLNDSRATRPAMVPVTARITRRMTRFPLRTRTTRSGCAAVVPRRHAARGRRRRSCRPARRRTLPAGPGRAPGTAAPAATAGLSGSGPATRPGSARSRRARPRSRRVPRGTRGPARCWPGRSG